MHELRLSSTSRSQSASTICSVGCGRLLPALLTRMSTRPIAASALSASRRTFSRCVMSATKWATRTLVPAWISASAATSSSSWRLEMTTLAPAWAKPRAMALPSPLLPPVTRATRPVRSKSWRFIIIRRSCDRDCKGRRVIAGHCVRAAAERHAEMQTNGWAAGSRCGPPVSAEAASVMHP